VFSTTEVTVALSGTLDTFALPDVLRLLASTGKTGRLRISGDRGSGSVWLNSGEVSATELTTVSSGESSDADIIFGLLRFSAGSFSFEADAASPNASASIALEPILAEAESMMTEWRSIEEVVPSLAVWVGLCRELHGPDVMIDSLRWKCIAAVGSGAQVGLVAEELHFNEIEMCRLIKELIELRLVELIDAPIPDVVEVEVEPEFDPIGDPPEPVAVADIVAEEPLVEPAPVAAHQDDFSASFDDVPNTVPSLASLAPVEEVEADATFDQTSPDLFADNDNDNAANADDLNPAEMARQLANLSPKAAKAVAAAAKASTDAERDAALAAVEAEDGTVNRGLLLKFLGSVDS